MIFNGYFLFDETYAEKLQERFKVKEMGYQGLGYLCLTDDDRIYNFLTGNYIENKSNIQSWCGEYYITKNGNIYNSYNCNLIVEGMNLDQWFYTGILVPYRCIIVTNDGGFYYIDEQDDVNFVSNNVSIDAWYDNRYYLQGNDLYYIDFNNNVVSLVLVLNNVNIKQWYGPYHFITNSNDLYYGSSKIAENVDIKNWHAYVNSDTFFYQTNNNDLYDYQGNLVDSNVNIKYWSRIYGCYITQDDKLFYMRKSDCGRCFGNVLG